MIKPEGTAPDINPGYPSGGAMISLAWQAMWDALKPTDGYARWVRGDRLAEIGASAGLVQTATAVQLLRAARAADLLFVEERRCAEDGEKVRKLAFYRRPLTLWVVDS